VPLDNTATKVTAQDLGDGELAVVDVVGPTLYTVGGEVIPGGYLGLRVGGRFDSIEGRALDPANGYAKWDAATQTLKFYTAADVEQGAIDLSADTYRLTVQGR